MKHFGIFLGYSPEQKIRKEGLGRLLAFIINGSISLDNTKLTIACPFWFRNNLLELFDEHNIDVNKIRIISTKNLPIGLKLHQLLKYFFALFSTKENKNRKKFKDRLHALIMFFVSEVISSSSFLGYLGTATSFLLLLILSVPSVCLFIISIFFKKVFKKKLSQTLHRIKSISILPLKNFKNRPWAIELHNIIRRKELSRLIVLINQEKDIKAWLIPTLFWPEVKQIAAKKVIVAPDIVMYDFPIYFSDSGSTSSLNRLEESISIADKFITYSEYVKDMHLVMMNGVNPQDVSVIGHGRIDMSHFLSIQGKKQDLSIQKEVAKEILIQYRNKHLSGNHYWSFTEFDKINYILYSSQLRGYKNIIILLKLVKILNFEKNIDVKLVVTGDIFKDSNLSKYINKNKLESIVLSAYDIPSEVLAAFNSLAKISVTPTLFEGGFPFTFCEAYSVGTPSILSNIPVVREKTKFLSADTQNRILFDPYDIHDLVEKVLWGLEHNDELLEMQKDLYNSYPTWTQVAKEYIDVLTVE